MKQYAIDLMDVKDIFHSDPEVLGGTPVFVGRGCPGVSGHSVRRILRLPDPSLRSG
jgi:uncharacterized protein (DUF433 family)